MDTKKLRQKILDLAIRGKLVSQDPNDEPASMLLERIRAEKERLIAEGKIKRPKKSKSSSSDNGTYTYICSAKFYIFQYRTTTQWFALPQQSANIRNATFSIARLIYFQRFSIFFCQNYDMVTEA